MNNPESSTMKAAFVKKYGKEENLILGKVPVPKCEDNDVLILIHAASVNPIDFKTRNGDLRLFRKYNFPLILGHDCSGEVIRIGKNVTRFKVGDLVFTRPRNGRIGTFSEKIAVNENEVALKPENLTHIEAACIPLVALTSYQVIHDVMKIASGQKILIQAGSCGIGSIAIQIAKQAGAEVWTTTSSKNIDFVKSLGADHVIDYKKENVFKVSNDFDAVFDTIGGDALYESFECVKTGGFVVSISGTPDHKSAKQAGFGFLKTEFMRFYGRRANKLAKKYNVQYSFHFMESRGDQLEIIQSMIDERKLRTSIDKVFDLDNIGKAIKYSESGRARGKIAISIRSK